jgi:hypothetical protein
MFEIGAAVVAALNASSNEAALTQAACLAFASKALSIVAFVNVFM